MTREITHMRAFAAALESMGKPPFTIGRIAPTPGLVDQFFNDSTGEGDHGEVDGRGPWNEGEAWEFVEAPAFQTMHETGDDSPSIHAASSEGPSDMLEDLLIDQLRDILHAEKQLLKALPKMAKAARTSQLQLLFETHLGETELQVERLNESLKILGGAARAKPCKGMAGLVEEGQEVMDEGKQKDDAPADLALIGAAQRVEHYEIAAYTAARNLALQLHQPVIVHLMTQSLGEEQNADQLLDQVAQPLMSVARMPASVA
jgi:Mn-containing catalase